MKRVIKFIEEHKDYYPEYFIDNRLSKCKYGYTCDIDQIYCYLNKVDIKDTVYYHFYEFSLQNFDLKNMKILEVACGYIPILSSIYKTNGINIDAINLKILKRNYKGVKTIEYDLTNQYDFSKYDLIIGLRPCEITEKLLDNCYQYQKNFIIYLCPCMHKPNNNCSILTYNDWINYLKEKTEKFENYNIQFIKQKGFPDDCPIIVGKISSSL